LHVAVCGILELFYFKVCSIKIWKQNLNLVNWYFVLLFHCSEKCDYLFNFFGCNYLGHPVHFLQWACYSWIFINQWQTLRKAIATNDAKTWFLFFFIGTILVKRQCEKAGDLNNHSLDYFCSLVSMSQRKDLWWLPFSNVTQYLEMFANSILVYNLRWLYGHINIIFGFSLCLSNYDFIMHGSIWQYDCKIYIAVGKGNICCWWFFFNLVI